jgi:hypothetical protein
MGAGDEEDKVHPHLLMVAPEWPAVDKLQAEEVLVHNIKAAEDLNLGPFMALPAYDSDETPLWPIRLCTRLISRRIRLLRS